MSAAPLLLLLLLAGPLASAGRPLLEATTGGGDASLSTQSASAAAAADGDADAWWTSGNSGTKAAVGAAAAGAKGSDAVTNDIQAQLEAIAAEAEVGDRAGKATRSQQSEGEIEEGETGRFDSEVGHSAAIAAVSVQQRQQPAEPGAQTGAEEEFRKQGSAHHSGETTAEEDQAEQEQAGAAGGKVQRGTGDAQVFADGEDDEAEEAGAGSEALSERHLVEGAAAGGIEEAGSNLLASEQVQPTIAEEEEAEDVEASFVEGAAAGQRPHQGEAAGAGEDWEDEEEEAEAEATAGAGAAGRASAGSADEDEDDDFFESEVDGAAGRAQVLRDESAEGMSLSEVDEAGGAAEVEEEPQSASATSGSGSGAHSAVSDWEEEWGDE